MYEIELASTGITFIQDVMNISHDSHTHTHTTAWWSLPYEKKVG